LALVSVKVQAEKLVESIHTAEATIGEKGHLCRSLFSCNPFGMHILMEENMRR